MPPWFLSGICRFLRHLIVLNAVWNRRKGGRQSLLQILNRGAGKVVATVVELVVGVSFDLDETDLVNLHKREKFLPQIDVFDFVLACRAPTAHNPTVYPALQKRFDGIGTVTVYGDDARFFEHFEPLYDGGEFHAVVGGGLFRSACLFFVAFVEHNATPASNARIARTRTVSVDFNFLFHIYIVHNIAEVCKKDIKYKKEEAPKYFFVAGETRFVRSQGDWNNGVCKCNLQNEMSHETADARSVVPSRMRCVF